MLITDAQVHLWEPSRPDRPWAPGRDVSPQHVRYASGFSADQLLAEMAAAGVDRAALVPPSWAGNRNETALEAAQAYPDRFGVMGRFDPTASGGPEQLEGWLTQPGMLGIRMTFNHPQYAAWLDDGTLDWFWPAAERLGIPLMVHAPGMLPKIVPVAERHPGLTVIIDHLGGLTQPTGEADPGNIEDLLRLASYPNVHTKATSLPALSREPYPHADLHPLLRRVYDSFGTQRMMWGSDFTRLRGSYRDCLALVQEALDFLSPEDREWITGKALAHALRWPEQGAV